MRTLYELKEYSLKADYKIYKKWLFSISRSISDETYAYCEGVDKIKELCGIPIVKPDISKLVPVVTDCTTEGRYLINFKKPESWHGNYPLPANIRPYPYGGGRSFIVWDNGFQCVIAHDKVNVYILGD